MDEEARGAVEGGGGRTWFRMVNEHVSDSDETSTQQEETWGKR